MKFYFINWGKYHRTWCITPALVFSTSYGATELYLEWLCFVAGVRLGEPE